MCIFFHTNVCLGNALFALPPCPRLTIFVAATIVRHKSTQIAETESLAALTASVSLSALQSFVSMLLHFATFMHTLTPPVAPCRATHLTEQSQLRNPSHRWLPLQSPDPHLNQSVVSFVNQPLTR